MRFIPSVRFSCRQYSRGDFFTIYPDNDYGRTHMGLSVRDHKISSEDWPFLLFECFGFDAKMWEKEFRVYLGLSEWSEESLFLHHI